MKAFLPPKGENRCIKTITFKQNKIQQVPPNLEAQCLTSRTHDLLSSNIPGQVQSSGFSIANTYTACLAGSGYLHC